MKVIAVANQKGGVGKTAIALHIAWFGVLQKKRALIIDLDAQQNTTESLIDRHNLPDSLKAFELFQDNIDGKEPIKIEEYLSLIPADSSLTSVEALPMDKVITLKNHIKRFDPSYDLVIFDTPPNLGRRLIAALGASDYVVTPVTMDKFAISAAVDLQKTIGQVKKNINPNLTNIGIIPNRINQSVRAHKHYLHKLRQSLGDLVSPYQLVQRAHIEQAVNSRHPVWIKMNGQSARMAATEMKHTMEYIFGKVF